MTEAVAPSGAVARALLAGLEKAGDISRPAIHAHIARVRGSGDESTPAQVIDALGRQLTASVATSGAAAGGVAAAPGVTLAPGMALAVGDATLFTGVAAMYVFAVAEIYGLSTEDVVRRRTLLMGVLLGDSGTRTVTEMAGRTGAHWGRRVVQGIPVETLRLVNGALGKNFVTKYGTKQGILVLGKVVPFGIGAVIGGAGNAMFARFTIRSVKRALGPAPEEWPAFLRHGADWTGPPEPDVIRGEIVETDSDS